MLFTRCFIRFGHIYLKNIVSLVLFRLEPVREELFNVKFIFGVCIRQVFVIPVLRDIKLIGQKRPHAAKLQDALGAVQHADQKEIRANAALWEQSISVLYRSSQITAQSEPLEAAKNERKNWASGFC